MEVSNDQMYAFKRLKTIVNQQFSKLIANHAQNKRLLSYVGTLTVLQGYFETSMHPAMPRSGGG